VVSEGADHCTRGACSPDTDPQRDSIFTKGPADVLDHATTEMAIGSKLGIDATKKLPGGGHKDV
jgi:4-hydroxy-3-polyprenylbenzoate decarboxylase